MSRPTLWGDIGQVRDKLDNVPRDKSWLQFLPDGSSVISAAGYGGSYWSQTGKIDIRLANGKTEAWFIKISEGEGGKKMAFGEFESLQLLYRISPDLVPKPIGCGTYESDSDFHFLLCEFVELYDELPDVVDFCHAIAEMHRKSMKHSPNSMFGFHVPSCNETFEQHTKFTSSWEMFFTETLKEAFDREEEVRGPDPEILDLLPALFEKVCPRLLRPMETEGRNLRPCLVHGCLEDTNIAVRAKTGTPIIFDASALWAHNEYEMHIWRGARYRPGRTFMREYFHHFPISPPIEDWSDRNLLYSLVADLHSSTHFRQTERFRELLIASMKELVHKFPNGYEGSAKRKDVAALHDQNGSRGEQLG